MSTAEREKSRKCISAPVNSANYDFRVLEKIFIDNIYEIVYNINIVKL